MPIEIKECEPCGRAFIASTCPQHCGSDCCRRRSCPNMVPRTRTPKSQSKYRTCIACGRSNVRFPFERFAACDSNCHVTIVNGRQGTGATKVRVRYCDGIWMPGMESLHRPSARPRVHIKYCSLKCWALPETGHDARRRLGSRVRSTRYWSKVGNKSAYLNELKRQRARDQGPSST